MKLFNFIHDNRKKHKTNKELIQLEQRIITAAQTGKPIEIQGRAYFVQTDLQHLKTLIN